MAQKDIIKKNFKEYFELGEYALNNNKFNGAVTLFYKALVELCDYELLTKLNKLGANHTERFELLEQANKKLYEISRKMFRFYRDSYNKEMSKGVAKLVKENVEKSRRVVLSEKEDKGMDKKE